ncbi:hypothetical protein L0244_01285 [bacterium]|nr:hypothetical protein [bacterium]MCI0611600.1 hypothetical protein [bacterium]
MKKISIVVMAFAVVVFMGLDIAAENKQTANGKIQFKDVRSQTAEFIGYYKSIQLTKQQEQIKQDALSPIPAPCCSTYSIATCCCPCNLAKSVWGLSHYLIAKKNYDAQQVKSTVVDWLNFTNKSRYTGDACFEGRCGEPFKNDGCGGMKESQVSS